MSIEYTPFMAFLKDALTRMSEALTEQQQALATHSLDQLSQELTWSTDLFTKSARYEVFNSVYQQLDNAPKHLSDTDKMQLIKPHVLREVCARGKWIESSTNPLDNLMYRSRLAAYCEIAAELL